MAKPLKAEEEFFAAIRSAPEADGPLLIYADWLEERGAVERAEHLRLSVERERTGPWGPRAREIEARLLKLHNAPGERGRLFEVVPMPRLDGVQWLNMDRGLFREARFATGGTFLRHGDRAMRATVVDQVLIANAWERSGAQLLSKSSVWRFVRRLELKGAPGRNEDLVRFLTSPFLDCLEGLSLNQVGEGEGAVRALAQSSILGQLLSLTLESNRIGPKGAIALAEALGPNAPLQSLEVFNNWIGNVGARALARSPGRSSIRRLDLSHGAIDFNGLIDWCRTGDWSNLESLELDSNPIGDLGALALAECPTLGRLKSLALQGAGLGPKGAAHLANSSALSALESLDLSTNRLREAGARALLDSTKLGALRRLDLFQAEVPPSMVALLRRRFSEVYD